MAEAAEPADDAPPSLLETYLRRRPVMRQFFQARLGRGADVEDLVQELFLKVRQIPTSELIHSPEAYLYRLASNLMLDRLRQARRAGARDGAWRMLNQAAVGTADVVETPDAETALLARERLQRLTAALETLAPITRRAFQLHKFDGLTHGQTAERLGISRSAVEKHISLALRHLMIRVGS